MHIYAIVMLSIIGDTIAYNTNISNTKLFAA